MDTKDIAEAVAELAEKMAQERMELLAREITELLAKYGVGKGVTPVTLNTSNPGSRRWTPPPADTDAGRVLHAVQTSKGLPRADAKRSAERAKGSAIKLKTFNTALRRLTDRGFIRQEGGRLYPVERKMDAA
jgi:hypothetical protein